MPNDRFEFKKFGVSHHISSMKVGLDSILLGSWSDIDNAKKILDVGTGCGILALMCAQRNSEALIEAIDIDESSVLEALENFSKSPWRDRIKGSRTNFLEHTGNNYDLIISNPPYFDSGINKILSSREKARHQDSLSPKIIIERGQSMLSPAGRISMIIPVLQEKSLIEYASTQQMILKRRVLIKGRAELKAKRVMMEFVKNNSNNRYNINEKNSVLILEENHGIPTKQFRSLCKDFYLKF